MSKCTKCGEPIEADRLAWSAPTCSSCSAEGCGVPWLHGAPIRRCEACDCMPPLEHAFGEQLAKLEDPAMFHMEQLGRGELFHNGRKLGDIVEISLVDRPAYPWGGDPAKITMLKDKPRIRGTLRIKL